MDVTARSKIKIVLWGRTQAHLEFFLLERGYLKLSFLDYAILNNLLASEIGSTKVRILYFSHILIYILISWKLKTTKLTKLSYTSLKSWLKNLSRCHHGHQSTKRTKKFSWRTSLACFSGLVVDHEHWKLCHSGMFTGRSSKTLPAAQTRSVNNQEVNFSRILDWRNIP